MKKVIYSSLLLSVFVVVVLLTGCGDKANAGMKTENNQASVATKSSTEESASENKAAFDFANYESYWSDEKTKALVYTAIENYSIKITNRSNYDVIPDDPGLYNQIAGIENAVPYVLRWVLESENGDDGKGVMAVAIANKLLEKDIVVDNAELPEGFECEYMEGTPKYFAARRVAAENK